LVTRDNTSEKIHPVARGIENRLIALNNRGKIAISVSCNENHDTFAKTRHIDEAAAIKGRSSG
jgi:hypothetical protein